MNSILFYHRDFSPRVQPGYDFKVQHLTWSDAGGPETALLEAPGWDDPAEALARGLPDLLRCPLTVLDEAGMPAWWGWVQRVELRWAGVSAAWDLSGMVNRAAAVYAAPAAPGPWTTALQVTPWVDDAASQARFGVKESLLRVDSTSLAAASAARDRLLAESAWPAARIIPGQSATAPRLRLTALGWQHTFDWALAPRTDGLVEYAPAGGVLQALGASSAVTALAQSISFTQAGLYPRIWLRAGRKGAPADSLRVAIHADSGGTPAASPLTSLLVSGSTLNPSPGWELFTLPAAIGFNPGETGWIVLSRSGSPSAANYYELALDEGAYYPGGEVKIHDGSAWAARSPQADLCFRLEAVENAGDSLARVLNPAAGGGGQFLTGVQAYASPGVLLPVPRGDFATCGDLFRSALAGAEPTVALVTPERVLRVEPRPSDPDRLLDAHGRLLNLNGQPLPLHQACAGHWAVFAPGVLDAPVYIRRTVWTEKAGLRIEMR